MADVNLVQLVFDRSALSPDEDVAVMTMHMRAVVASAPDIIPVTQTIRDEFVGNIGGWWNVAKGHVSGKYVLTQARFYDVPSTPNADMGDPAFIATFNAPGVSPGQALPPQCALSHTWRTPARLTWGRFYLPGITSTILDVNGRVMPAICDEMAQAALQLTSRGGTGGALTVFSRKTWSHHDPDKVQVDDIVDIVRRRRFSSTHYRATIDASS